MENSPLSSTTEKSSADKNSESSSTTKRKKKIGEVAVDVQPKARSDAAERPAGLFGKSKKAEAEKTAPEAQKHRTAEAAAAALPELPATASPDRLDSTEQHLVEREAVEQQRVEAANGLQPAEATAEELAAERAIENFRDKIVLEGKPAAKAVAETLAEIPDVAEETLAEVPGAGGSGMPPRVPGPNGGFMPPFGPGPGPGGNSNAYPTPAAANTLSNSNMIPVEDAMYHVRRAETRGLLVGGVFGYLIGRRRGRIKAEKRLLPIQKKLEKEAKGLRAEVMNQENTIREATVREMRLRDAERSQKLLPRSAGERRPTAAELRRTPAPGAELLHAKNLPPQRIGHVLMTAQAERATRRTPVPEAQPKTVEAAASKALSPEEQAETMTRNELLTLSEKIAVDGATLRQIYQTHLVGERGLRRIVTEYLRGGDIKRQLRRELVEREIDFERDPILRDRARSSISTGSGRSVLDNLLIKAGAVSTAEATEQLAIQKSQAAHEQAEAARRQQQRRMADISLVGTIVVLIALVIVLLLTRY
jgi:hypothetical protein